jgi:hypothetical protein
VNYQAQLHYRGSRIDLDDMMKLIESRTGIGNRDGHCNLCPVDLECPSGLKFEPVYPILRHLIQKGYCVNIGFIVDNHRAIFPVTTDA